MTRKPPEAPSLLRPAAGTVPKVPASGSGEQGTLVLVGTPIGNLGDLSPRAVETLASADAIACEDTRRTRQLLTHAGVPARSKLLSLNEHNEAGRIPQLLTRLGSGETIAVVADAGMPGISDPGTRLVAAASAAGITVSVVPGPSAAIAALVVSGLPTRAFCFEGFLPRKGRTRKGIISAIGDSTRTTVLYESPHRVAATLADLAGSCGEERRVAVVRELTKVHEEVWRGTLGAAIAIAAESATSGAKPRGEHVIVVEGSAPRRGDSGTGGTDLDGPRKRDPGRGSTGHGDPDFGGPGRGGPEKSATPAATS